MADEKVLIEIEVDNQQALRDLNKQNAEKGIKIAKEGIKRIRVIISANK